MQPAVELKDVSFAYPGGPEVLSCVDLEIRRGEFVTIAGPNGGGKTTLLRVALGLEEPVSGEARLFGEPADRVRDRYRIGYLAQRTRLAIDAPATVGEVVTAGRVARRGLLRPFGHADRGAIADAISSSSTVSISMAVVASTSTTPTLPKNRCPAERKAAASIT